MALLPAVRYVAATTKSALGAIHLQCHVRPGTSKQRQGIMSISEDFIEVCVAAQARGGEANKAVKELLSRALKCPKSDVEVVRGLKSRAKTIAIGGIDAKENQEQVAFDIRARIEGSISGLNH